MFAFAVLDERRRTLFLARDFFGIKPLYYVQSPAGFAFASEIKALLDWLPLKRTVQPERLYAYLRFGQTDHGAETMWREVRQVPAAHYLEVPLDRPDQSELVRYWEVPGAEVLDVSFEEAALQAAHAVPEQYPPAFAQRCSGWGGVVRGHRFVGDRGRHGAVAPDTEIHAFSYIADDPEVSEERWVDLVGKHSGAILHKIHARPDELSADLDRLIATQDEPFGSTSIYAQYRVFRLAQEHGIKVMLDGQGADELLAGYRSSVPARLSSLVRHGARSGRPLRRTCQPIAGHAWTAAALAASSAPLTPGPASRWLQRRADAPRWLNSGWFRKQGVALFPGNDPMQHDMMREELRQAVAATSLPMLLRYEDRNSMAALIESRVPFLTPDLADFVLRLPEEYLLGKDGTSKNVFRQAMRGHRAGRHPGPPRQDRLRDAGAGLARRCARGSIRRWRASGPQHRGPGRARHAARLAGGAGRPGSFRLPHLANGSTLIRWAERFDVDFEN